jgi:amidase
MDREGLYHCPAVQRPTTQQLQSLAEAAHLTISPEDLEQYKEHVSRLLTIYDHVDKMVEPTPVTKYQQLPGYQPSPRNNPYNAWARMTDIVGSSIGKLAGKTVVIKDSIHVAGVPLTNGSSFFRGFISPYNATVVDRILDEGGRITGKASCENLCMSGNSFTCASGPILNPYDITRSAGGSCSGNAVLLATGEVDMAVGADSGGSIRLPSCWCGVVGLKPTYGLVPSSGKINMDPTLDHIGPMARTVYDCALLLEVIAGCDGVDSHQSPTMKVPKFTEQLTGEVSGLRVGLLKEGFDGCEPDVAETVRNAADSLKQLGVTVNEFSTSLHNDLTIITTLILLEGTYDTFCKGGLNPLNSRDFKNTPLHDFWFNASHSPAANTFPPSIRLVILLASYIRENYGCHFYAKSINILRELTAKYDELFQNYDVIIMPTIKNKAPKLPKCTISVQEYLNQIIGNGKNTTTYNGTGHPALSINAGFSDTEPRLPIGMMMVGRRHDDVTVLRLAHAYERLRDSSPAYVEVETALKSAMKSKASSSSL